MTQLPPLDSLQWLQGTYEAQYDVQLGLMIQPNCPGCHSHALPVMNELYASFERDFGVYVISTAFEDFDYNTIEAATALVKEGRLVGAAKEQLGAVAPCVPLAPMAHDCVVPKASADAALIEQALQATRHNAQQHGKGFHPVLLQAALERLGPEVLPLKLARMFYAVTAMGTPTWYLHTLSGELLGSCFGQVTIEQLSQWIRDTRRQSAETNNVSTEKTA